MKHLLDCCNPYSEAKKRENSINDEKRKRKMISVPLLAPVCG